ncbi:MAG: chromosome segregation protein ScpA [Gemmataceae bacterium]
MMQDLPPRSSTDAYRVRLDHFQGPLDLLLYLVRRQEVNILDIPIARIAEQFLDFLQALQALDLDGIGEFLVMAGTLMEIKSRMLLPAMEREDGESEDPRVELVRQLVEYRRYKEAAQLLEERARDRARCLPRPAAAWNEQSDERTPEQVEIWDLVSAFGRLLRQAETPVVSELPEDQPPLHHVMEGILAVVRQRGRVEFADVFQPPRTRLRLVSTFIALLELVRHGQLRVEQTEPFGAIWITAGEALHGNASGPHGVSGSQPKQEPEQKDNRQDDGGTDE